MDYKKIGKEIFDLVGGNNNITQMTHCATRLRFVLKDFSSIDHEKLKAIPGVLDVIFKGGQLQVIIGPDVPEVYRAADALYTGSKNNNNEKGENQNILNRIMAVVVGIFNPMLPAITGAGMIKAVLALLKAFSLIDVNGQTFAILSFISDSAFYFMPMILAYSSAKVFKCSPGLAITLAGVLLHPNFIAMKNAGEAVKFAGINVPLAGYASTVIPIILIVFLMSYVERFAEKILPVHIKYIGRPLIILLVMAPLSLIVVGPLGVNIGNILAAGIAFLDNKAGWVVPTVIGTFTPLLVMFGLHNGLFPIATTQLGVSGHESIMGPGMLPSNVAQGAACMAVAVKTKSKEMRQQAISAGITALLGITEPAMYGVTLRLKKPLIAVMIGGGLGGLYAGLTGVVRYSFGSPGFATLPVFISDDPANIRNALISAFIGIIVSFVLTLLIKFDYNYGSPEEVTTDQALSAARPILQTAVINSPLSGEVTSLSEVNDEIFSKGLLGKGVAVIPNEGKVTAPYDAEVSIIETKHAVAFTGDNGIDLLVHVGIDTVELNGKYFNCKVKNGDKVKAGDVVLEFDINAIKKAGYKIITPIIITNSNEFESITQISSENIISGKPILNLEV